ncbi:MAG: co-chaperone GroES [Candidatus Terrybacteria bacterium]|nr:co-chaperone GroES [Candidatus Terrybacteria bacterium]
MTKIKPLHNNVLIEPLSEAERGSMTKSGIIIPETVDKEKPDQGRIIEVGPGKRNEAGKIIPLSVKKGQRVVFSKYSPDEIKVGDPYGQAKKYYIISEDNILAIIE